MEKTSEKVVNFNGMPVVDHVVVIDNEGNKSEAWLTPIEGFTATKNALGADTLDTNEDNSRVYLFKGDELVGDYRLTNKLKGKLCNSRTN